MDSAALRYLETPWEHVESLSFARPRRWLSWAILGVLLAAVGSAAGVLGYRRAQHAAQVSRVVVAAVDIGEVILPPVALVVPVYAGGEWAVWHTTEREIVSSPALWRRLHVAQWNDVPARLRAHAFDNMVDDYRSLLVRPFVWDQMQAEDWDVVPQPMRITAFRHMVTYWAGHHDVGTKYGLPPAAVADTLAAIVMAESWFEHRTVTTNAEGNRDIGLAQASDFARDRARALFRTGEFPVHLSDEDYLNPWSATRFVALSMTLLLDESRGDFDVAVGAYHRGVARASDARGTAYRETVNQRLRRYIRNQNAPPAWDDLWRRGDQLRHDEWRWLAPPSSGRAMAPKVADT